MTKTSRAKKVIKPFAAFLKDPWQFVNYFQIVFNKFAMSELPVNKQKLNFFIHSESPHNKLNYVYNQAIAENEVIYTFSIKNALLLSIANKPMGNYVEIINNLITDCVIKIKEDSKNTYREYAVSFQFIFNLTNLTKGV